MRITEILNSSKPVLSIEVFPPKSDANFESVCHATEEIAKLNPAFISVTYGAGGVTDQYTMEIARRMLAAGVTPLPHLTCLTSDKAQIAEKLQEMKDCGIENIMALRGDIPRDLQDMSKL
ncbi:MAG: methylenetetrahydrofolate reductase, partial [Firmicutes bacterium]|nr:methylenetetrahydrofolate reductase [Bacillota bacterium]